MRTETRFLLARALPPLQNLTLPDPLPGFELTFTSSGRTFKAFVRARNAEAASNEAILELAHQCAEFEPERARLVAAVQTR